MLELNSYHYSSKTSCVHSYLFHHMKWCEIHCFPLQMQWSEGLSLAEEAMQILPRTHHRCGRVGQIGGSGCVSGDPV